MLLSSKGLEDLIDRDRIMLEYDEAAVMYMDWKIVSALEEWTTSRSRMICIVGTNQVVDTPSTTMLATEYVASANQASIPTISYFCELPRPHTDPLKPMTAEVSGLISLTYALIRQLIELLPSFMDYAEDLGVQRFANLDGSLESYPEAITLLSDLLDLSPPMLVCVIDGIEVLEDKSTAAHMTAFIKILQGHKTYRGPLSKGSDRVLKVLFITSGRSRVLLTELESDELVFVEQAGSAMKPGRPSVGRRSLSPTLLRSMKWDITL